MPLFSFLFKTVSEPPKLLFVVLVYQDIDSLVSFFLEPFKVLLLSMAVWCVWSPCSPISATEKHVGTFGAHLHESVNAVHDDPVCIRALNRTAPN